MDDKLELLEQKIEAVIERLERLRDENTELKSSNIGLKNELGSIRKQFDRAKLGQTDQSDAIKSKLVNILGRLTELEKLGE
jgi:FtsZ-binding cell division protein ZapB